MGTVFRYTLRRSRGQILGWGIALAVFAAYLVQFYDTLAKPGMKEQLEALLAGYPPELLAFFGDVSDMFEPAGFLHMEFFSYMPLILGIFSVLVGSGLIASDEEEGRLDLVLAHPVSRTALFFGRLGAFTAAILAILGITWLAFVLSIPSTTLGITAAEMVQVFLSLFAILLLFGTLALALSMLLPARRLAALTAGLVLVASFFITSLARLDENLESLNKISPLTYYQGGLAVEGLNWNWLAGLLGACVVLALLAWQRFQRRDIRVGGEGGWRLPGLFQRRTPAPPESAFFP